MVFLDKEIMVEMEDLVGQSTDTMVVEVVEELVL
jgi:hypothetical protein